jgi:cell division transport system permease protein
MTKNNKKASAKTVSRQKRSRRKWVTFMRMLRYGVNNFSRNAWLTIAATAVMTITLFVIFASVSARQVLVDTVAQLRDRVDMSIYVLNETSEEAVQTIRGDLSQLPSVTAVAYVSPEEAREDFIQQNRESPETLDAVREATNRFPGTFSIKVQDINDTTELRDFVDTNETYLANADAARDPSFAGERRPVLAFALGNLVPA